VEQNANGTVLKTQPAVTQTAEESWFY
jgi:hypothetical protein